jgi:antitoxin HicB
MQYPALFTPAKEGGFVITFPDVPGAITQAEDEREGVEMAQDALVTLFEHYIRGGVDIPAPRQRSPRRFRMIDLPAIVGVKVALYRAFRASGITKTELASRLGIAKTNVDRLFNIRNQTRLDQLENAFAALGQRLEISVTRAA